MFTCAMYDNDRTCACFGDILEPVTRFWGLSTAVVLIGVGVDIILHNNIVGVYILIGSILVLILETSWVVSLFLKFFKEPCKCWTFILWIDTWKRGIVYLLFGSALIYQPQKLWVSYLAGIMLYVLAIAHYLLTSVKKRLSERIMVPTTDPSDMESI